MQARTLGEYGAPYVDARPIQNPTTQLAASKANRLMEDAAQLTRTGYRAIVRVEVKPGQPTVLQAHETIWGSGSTTAPTIVDVAPGIVRLDFASSYTDGLGESEPVAFAFAHASLGASTAPGLAIVNDLGSNFAEITLRDLAGAVGDLGGAVVTVWIR